MPVNVRWDDEAKTIAIYALEGECAQEEMSNAQRELDALTRSVSHKVGVIMDLRHGAMSLVARTVQIGGRERSVLRGDFGSSRKPDGVTTSGQVAITVFLMPEGVLNSAGDVFRKMVEVTGSNAVFASTIEEARKIIAEHLSSDSEN